VWFATCVRAQPLRPHADKAKGVLVS
jgi:hypothetical protein